ncbi:carbon storage regulator CsrA [Cohnella luojiensis]|uniref:Translational regulator CsrA n=1 Tax=Cohnella luojiensis TaxID=652876 RepID=A0A4Y8M7V2_9BACL|nr:carbon storage regulator CsrA [Cohnella luojiensis]TFE29030.1 carbon storage regulator CsrA [Cohnella luojiensis]
MLVLSRKKGQSVIIQDQIEVTILEIDGETIKLGISAPREVQIVRKELLASIKETNRDAAGLQLDVRSLSDKIKKMKNFSE